LCAIVFIPSPLYFGRIFPGPIGKLAAEFVQWGPLYLVSLFVTTALTRMLNSLGLAKLPLMATAVSVVASFLFNWVCIGYGMSGAAVALSLTSFVQCAALIGLVWWHPASRHAWGSPWRLPLSEVLELTSMREFFRLGLPSVGVVVAETTPFTLMVVFASLVGGPQASAYSATYSTINLLFATSYGISAAAASRIGNALGANRPQRARRLCLVAVGMVACVATVNACALSAFHRLLFGVFTSDEEVLAVAASLTHLAAITHVADCLQFVFQGIFTACGMNHIGFVVLLVSLIGVSVPAAAVMTFYFHLGAFGLYCGLCAGLLVASPLFGSVVFGKFDFYALAKAAAARKIRG
jgi:MATE family multidrug resistance protein